MCVCVCACVSVCVRACVCVCVWTRASTLCFYFILFFSAFEHVKNLVIMGPNDIKNSSLKCDFHIINYE
jgi:hypothetical protein